MEDDPEAPASITNAMLQNMLHRLTYLESLVDSQTGLIETLSASRRSNSEPKIADPDPFDGNRLQLINFLSKCRLKFLGQPSRYPDEISKILYAGSRLAEPAYSWFQPLLAAASASDQPTPSEFGSFEAFAKALTEIYGDPNLEATSERQINALEQTTSVAQYIAEFQRLRQHIKWDESALMDRFYRGLKGAVKDEIARVGRPSTLKALQDFASRFDARMQERFLEKRQAPMTAIRPNPSTTVTRPNLLPNSAPLSRSSSQSSSITNAPITPSRTPSPATTPSAFIAPSTALKTPAFTSDGTVPMELSANGEWHLTAAEKIRRRHLGLCGYCGSSQHRVVDCPGRPPNVTPKLPRFATQAAISFDITPPEEPPKDNTQE